MRRCLPAVLVPSFHLGVGQSEFGGQFQPVLNAEVFLALETFLQRLQLMVGKGRAGLSGFFAQAGRRFVGSVSAFAGRAAAMVVVMAATSSTAAILVSIFIVVFS